MPVEPEYAITSPRLTVFPAITLFRVLCAYTVESPCPCSMTTILPLPPLRPEKEPRPTSHDLSARAMRGVSFAPDSNELQVTVQLTELGSGAVIRDMALRRRIDDPRYFELQSGIAQAVSVALKVAIPGDTTNVRSSEGDVKYIINTVAQKYWLSEFADADADVQDLDD